MRTKLIALLCVLAMAGLPGMAMGQQFFDFNGQAKLPMGEGGVLSMYSIVFDAPPATTPIPLDFASFQYTLVIENLPLDTDGNPQTYSDGNIFLYEDAGTPADYNNPGTFTDGTLLLVGNINLLTRQVLIGPIGTVSASIDWLGGSRIDDLAPPDRLDWVLLSGTNSNNALPGYDEEWEGKVEPKEPVVSNGERSIGSLKSDFQR